MSVSAFLFFCLSLNINDCFHCELIDTVIHHSVEVKHLAARFAEVVLLSMSDRLCDQCVIAVRCRLEADDTTARGQLPSYHWIVTTDENRDTRAILGHITGQNSRLGLYDNEVNAEVLACFYSRGGKALRWCNILRRESLEVQIRRLVVDASLSFSTDLTEELYGFDGVITIRSLIIKHDGVGAIEDAC